MAKLFRCSGLHELVGDAKSIADELRTPEVDAVIKKKKRTEQEQVALDELKTQSLSETAKSAIRRIAKEDAFGFRSFTGNKYTEKGNFLENMAIAESGRARFMQLAKHVGRVENDLITGECDVLVKDRSLIIDTKCTWDIGTHPFFADEAAEKVKKAGYDWQMQGYMWLYGCEQAAIDFWLFPCPAELLNDWDDIDQLVHMVNAIDIRQRRTTVIIERDESMIQRIQDKIPHCQAYYKELLNQLKTGEAA